MEKVQWNSIDEKQNGLKYSKMTNHPPSPEYLNNKPIKYKTRHTYIYIYIYIYTHIASTMETYQRACFVMFT